MQRSWQTEVTMNVSFQFDVIFVAIRHPGRHVFIRVLDVREPACSIQESLEIAVHTKIVEYKYLV